MEDSDCERDDDYLSRMPELVLSNILQYLDAVDLLALSAVSSRFFYYIRHDDSLWVNLLEEFSFAIWDELIDDLQTLGDVYISDWFVHYFKRVRTRPSRTVPNEVAFEGEVENWSRIETTKLQIYRGIVSSSYEKYEDKNASVGILMRKYIYDIALYERRDASIPFESSSAIKDSVVSKLESLGQGRDRDLLNRRHHDLRSKYVTFAKVMRGIDPKTRSRLSEMFPCLLDKFPLEPIFVCKPSNTASMPPSISGVCGTRGFKSLTLQLLADEAFDEHFRVRKTKSDLRSFCETLESKFKEDKLGFTRSIEQGNARPLFDFACRHTQVPGQSCSKSHKWRQHWRKLLDDVPCLDRFIGVSRVKSRQRLKEQIREVLVPSGSGVTTVSRVDLTDAVELGRDNEKQEMSSALVVSKNAVLLVMQLIGKSRF